MADALTMVDLAVMEQRPLRKGFLMSMFKGRLPSPMDRLPVQAAKSLSQEILRMTDPGTANFRNLGASVSSYKATFANGIEVLKVIEDKVTLDKIYLEIDTFVQDPIAAQIRAYGDVVRALVNDMFINGDPGADETVPAGLRYRLQNDAMFLNQSIDAEGLDVDLNSTNMHKWLDFIDELITLVGGGRPDILIMNRQEWIRFRSVLRREKLLTTSKDSFDRVVSEYDGIPFINAGQKPAGLLTSAASQQVIPNNTQTSIYNTANTTPLYALKLGDEEGASLLQLHPLRTKKLGINTNNPAEYVIDFTWPVGFLIPQKFALGSIQGLVI